MRRREFITLLGGAAAWPLAARAQQPAMPVIGFLTANRPTVRRTFWAAFRHGLNDMGYVEGENVIGRVSLGGGPFDRLPALAADLVRRHVAVIVKRGARYRPCGEGGNHTLSLSSSWFAEDPVKFGLVGQPRPAGRQPYRDQFLLR